MPTILYTDASSFALGAVLTQEKEGEGRKIISFASKLLSKTEKAYPQVQKEALGIIWGAERFYYYLLGRQFAIRTDASGLSFIFNREKTVYKRTLNRAESYALRMNSFDYKIEWIRGKANIADPPSRLCMDPVDHPIMDRVPVEICSLQSEEGLREKLPENLTVEVMRQATKEGVELQGALKGSDWHPSLWRLEKIKDELREFDGILLRTGSVVMPKSLRQRALELGHLGHPGISAMKSVMRKAVWWPRLPTDVEEFVTACEGCQLASRPEQPVPMLSTTLPSTAWDKIVLDFNGPHANHGGKSILVIVDYFSRFLFAKFVRSTDFGSVKQVLTDLFDLFGNPREARTDNGPPFNGAE